MRTNFIKLAKDGKVKDGMTEWQRNEISYIS